MIACGLDFGTSNSAIGIVRDDAVALAPLEDDKTLIPSAVFFDYEAHRVLFGSDAISAYVGQAEGRLMRALKTILGSPLIDEKTSLGSRMVPLTEVVGIFVRHLKHKAEAFAGQEITAVVHGRPVRFVDGDEEADARAEAVLETIARQVGFRHVVFVPRADRRRLALRTDSAGRRAGVDRRHRRRHQRLLGGSHRAAAPRAHRSQPGTSWRRRARVSAARISTARSASPP